VTSNSTLELNTVDPAILGNMTLYNANLDVTGSAPSMSFADLRGNGRLTSPAEVILRETLAPGLSIGTLVINGNLTINDGVVYDWEMFSAAPGEYDQVIVNGNLTLGDWVLRLMEADYFAEALPDDKFYLFTDYVNDDALGLWSIDDSLIAGNSLWDTSGAFIAEDDLGIYLSGLFKAAPEPDSIALALLGLLGLGWCAWRKRR